MVFLFAHSNYPISGQTETIDLTEQSSRSDHSQKIFRRSNVNKSMHSTIDSDGLPYVGQVGLVFYSSYLNITFLVLTLTNNLKTFRQYNKINPITAPMMR